MVDFNLSLEDLKEASNCIYNTKLIVKTPILRDVGSIFNLNDKNYELNLKLESMQTSGSFKIRGVVNKIEKLKKLNQTDNLFTFSAGNYGKAFAYVCSMNKIKGRVILPDTAPESRISYIKVKIILLIDIF